MKALVVDDSAVMRKVLTGALDRCGIKEVTHAADGQEAVDAVTVREFDIVLMDCNTPVMSGIDAVRELRAMGKTMPIVMVTTEAEKEQVFEALKSGATHFIIKPFEPATIVTKIKEVIEMAGAS